MSVIIFSLLFLILTIFSEYSYAKVKDYLYNREKSTSSSDYDKFITIIIISLLLPTLSHTKRGRYNMFFIML
jgi:hypothetical protein